MPCIYQIRNLINNKIYIGSTWKELRFRKAEHLSQLRGNYHHSQYLQNSFNKYGIDNFSFEILEEFTFPPEYTREYIDEYLINQEIFWIGNLNPEYNICKEVSRGRIGRYHTEETKRLISIKRKGTKRADKPWLGRKHTDETKRKLSDILKGRKRGPFSQEHRDKLSKSNRGKKRSQETIEKFRKANLGKVHSPETKEKMRIAHRRRNPFSFLKRWAKLRRHKQKKRGGRHFVPHSRETKLKMSFAKRKNLPKRLIDIYSLNSELLHTCDLLCDAIQYSGVKSSAIRNNLYGISQKTKTFIFKYREVELG